MICPYCKKQIDDKATVCPNCGFPQKRKKEIYKQWWFWLIVAVVVLAAVGSISQASDDPAETTVPPRETSQTDRSSQPSEPPQTAALGISKEEYIADCLELNKDVGYKDLLREPDKYIGQKIKVVVKIRQIMDKSLFTSDKYYFGHTDNDGYGWYLDDELCFTDARPDDDMKIVEDDIIIVYGEFTGLEEFNRALTGVEKEVPVIDFKYIELIEDS